MSDAKDVRASSTSESRAKPSVFRSLSAARRRRAEVSAAGMMPARSAALSSRLIKRSRPVDIPKSSR
jgi:hypothetical protein